MHSRLQTDRMADFHILECTFSRMVPWTFPDISLCFSVSLLVKGHHHLHDLRSSTLKHWRKHASAVPVYTDGSKSDVGLGSSAAFPSFEAL